jgi:hypothetical protein
LVWFTIQRREMNENRRTRDGTDAIVTENRRNGCR